MSDEIDNDVILDLGDGLVVRRYRMSDITNQSRHANNRKLWLNMRNRFPHPYTEEDSKNWIIMNRQPENHVRSGEWTIEDGANGPLIPVNYSIALNGEAIGSIGLAFGTDVYFRSAELGYWIGEELWGRGIMGKVAPAFVKWSWKTFGILIRLNSEANDNNPGSIRTLVKAGFVYEGKRPNAVFKNGKVLSLETFGLLRPED